MFKGSALVVAALLFAACPGPNPPTLADQTLPETTVGVAYSQTFTATGGKAPVTFSATGVPAGLTLDSSTGALTGTATNAGDYAIAVTAKGADNATDQKTYPLKVYDAVSITTTALPDATSGAAYSTTLAATGGKAPLAFSITSGAVAPLTLSSAGVLSGTAPAAGTASLTVKVTDANGASASHTYSLTIYPAVAITTAALADGNVGKAYGQLVEATGGKAPLSFSRLSGALPPGVTIDTTSGLLSGTPTLAGTFNPTLAATDANGAVASAAFSLRIFNNLPPTVATAALANGVVGKSYSATLVASDGAPAYTWAIASGSLPAGLTLSGAGVLSGTPTAEGASTFQVRVTDGNGQSATKSLTLTVYTELLVAATTVPEGYVGDLFPAITFSATGGQTPYTWSISSGALPAGLNLSSGGLLSGTPTTTGAASFTVLVTDGSGQSATRAYTTTIYTPVAVATTALADATVAVAYSQTLSATGGKAPLTWSIASKPAWLTLNAATGDLSGTPSAAGTSTFVATATDANGKSASKSLSIAIYASLSILTSSPLPEAYASVAYTQSLGAAGGRPPYTWTLSAGTLPAGLTLDAAGALSGTPTTAGARTFTVTVTDANAAISSKSFDLTVVARPSISTASLPDGYVGLDYSQTVAVQNGMPPYTFATTAGALPAGLSLDPNTGALTGAPTAAGTSTFTVTATDGNNLTATRSYTVGVYAAPQITSASPLPDAYQGNAFTFTATGSGGKTPYTWALASGSLATGLTFTAGDISGTPTATATFSFSLRLTDANGQTATKSFTHTVRSPPTITTASFADAYAGRTYSASVSASGGKAPYTYSVSAGTLPAGLTFASGILSGTPTTAGASTFSITASDANAVTDTKSFTLTVYDAPVITTTAPADAYAGAAYSATLAASGGKAPLAWTVVGGLLPTGLSLGGTGTLAGTTTETGSFTFTAQLTDANGMTATKSLTLAVWPALDLATTALADAYTGQAYSGALAATGGKAPYTYSLSAGALPANLSLDGSTGALSGTPSSTGTSTFTAQVRDANNRIASRALTLAVLALPALATSSVQDGYVGTAYSASLSATGGKAPLAFTVTSGALPAGVSLSSGGALSGIPAAAGTTSFTVTVTDANGKTGSGPVQMTVYEALQISTALLPDSYQGLAFTATLAVTGGKTPYAWSSTALPNGLTLTSGGVLSGTPTAAGSTQVTFTVRDGNAVTNARQLTVDVLALPTIGNASLADGYVGSSYGATLAGSGGRAPYTFAAGPLPAGIVLDPSGTLSGTPTTAGTTTTTYTITDSNGKTGTRSLPLSVRDPLVVSTSTLADAYVGLGYSAALSATGGKTPYTWSVTSGALPAGTTLDANTGALSGTPTAAGTSSFTVQVADANGVTATRALSVQTYAQPSITTASPLPDAYSSVAYSQALAAVGGKPGYGWTVISGAPPAGIMLSSAGVLSGSATATGASNFTVQVTDANGKTATKAFTLNVNAGFNITTASIADGYTGNAFTQALSASGGLAPYSSWTIISGALPTGLTLNAGTGTISGTPTMTGSWSFTVQVQDSNSTLASKGFTQLTYAAPAVTTSSLPDSYTGEAYNQTLVASGGKAPLSWSVTAGSLPAGLTLTSTTGAISGSATATGTASFTVTATDANGMMASRPLTIGVYAPLVASPSALPDGYVGAPYAGSFTATGGKAPLGWAITSGALPPGIALASGTGALGGTPNTAGLASFTATVTDANGRTATRTGSIDVLPPLQVSTSSLPDGYLSVVYNAAVSASGGGTPYTWSISSGNLPAGLAFTTVSNTMQISGTPAASGTASFTVQVTDRNGVTATKPLQILITTPLTISTAALADAYQGTAYSHSVAATGGRPPYGFSIASGSLPAGITMSTAGAFTGTPTTVQMSSFVVQVTDANGTIATRALSIQVLAPLVIASAVYPDAYVTEPYTMVNSASGGRTPYTWSVTSGTLPTGLTIDPATGAISGAPAVTGSSTFTITVQDVNGVIASQPETIAVYALPMIISSSLPDAYETDPYNAPLTATGGKLPLTWSQSSGTLPAGLSVAPMGIIQGIVGTVTNGTPYAVYVRVSDPNGRSATSAFFLTAYKRPQILNTALTTATEGITYARAPGQPERIDAQYGKAPLAYSASGLPPGLALNAVGEIVGIPAQASAGTFLVTLTVSDANGVSTAMTLPLIVVEPRPFVGGGQVGVAPQGSAITDVLTVIAQNWDGRPLQNIGVRIRKNGAEFSPVKQALTGANGKVVFTGLGLNGTTDTVDITANGAEYANTTMGRVNAAFVAIVMPSLPNLRLRQYASATFDASIGKTLVTGGARRTGVRQACGTEVIAYSGTGTTEERLVSGLTTSPPPRYLAAMAYAGSGMSVLFGGADCDTGDYFGDGWQFNSTSNTWQPLPLTGGPGPRAEHAMASGAPGTVYVFGGRTTMGYGADLWRYTVSTGTWTSLPAWPIPARYGAGMVRLASGRVFICGGYSTSGYSSDCWLFDETTFTWTPAIASLPSPRSRFGMTPADPMGFTAFAFGGQVSGSNVFRNDVLYYDGTTWMQLTPDGDPSGPSQRRSAAVTYDAATDRLLVYGGYGRVGTGVGYLGDLWAFSRTTMSWTQLNAPAVTGFTVSGSISGGSTSTSSYASVNLASTSGWSRSASVRLTAGAGSYSISGVPAGETLRLIAINNDSMDPQNYVSMLEIPQIGPISADVTQNIAFPPRITATTLNGTLVAAPSWRFLTYQDMWATLVQPNYAQAPRIGTGSWPTKMGYSLPYLPVTAPAVARGWVYAYTEDPNACDWNQRRFDITATQVQLDDGPRSASPGRDTCHPIGVGFGPWPAWNQFGQSPVAVAVGMLNGDALPDVVAVNDASTNDVTVGLGAGSGNFESRAPMFGYSSPSDATLLDLNGDGRLDLVVANTGSSQLSIQYGNGDGTFSPPTFLFTGFSPTRLVQADMNGDGRNDLVLLTTGDQALSVYFNTGTGSLQLMGTTYLPLGSNAVDFTMGKFNTDNIPDAAVAMANNQIVMANGASGGAIFNPPFTLVTINTPVAIASGDITGDSLEDLVVGTSDGLVHAVRQTSPGLFAISSSFPVGGQVGAVALGDFDGDGRRDVVANNDGTGALQILTSSTSGMLTLYTSRNAWVPGRMAVTDVTLDGWADAVIASQGNGSIVVYPGARPAAAASDATISFTLPAAADEWWVTRGPVDLGDWSYEQPTTSLSVSLTWPLPSTLAPSRPAPANQNVTWESGVASYVGPFDFNNLRWAFQDPDAWIGSNGHTFRRQ